MNVTGFDELAALVNQDKASNIPSATRYPVRFIFVKDVWTVKNIVEMLKQRSAMVVDVSNVFPLNFSSDGFPTASTLLQEISTQDGDLVVVSAGNLIRFWSDDEFGLLVSSLMEFENSLRTPNRRIYVILEGLAERFDAVFWDKRRRHIGIDPRWVLDSPRSTVRVNMLRFDYQINGRNVLPDVKSLAGLWQGPKQDEFICCSQTLRTKTCYCSDDVVSFIDLDTPPEFLQKVMHIDVSCIPYEKGEDGFWTELINEFRNTKLHSVRTLLEKKYNLNNAEEANWTDIFVSKSKNDYERWVIKNFVVRCTDDDALEFVRLTFGAVRGMSVEEFVEQCWMSPFQETLSKELLAQRFVVLRDIHTLLGKRVPIQIERELEEKLSTGDPSTLAPLVTGITFAERKWLVRNWELVNDLKDKYSALHYYLSDVNVVSDSPFTDKLLAYINEYKRCKLRNTITDELESLLEDLNKDESSFYDWYYSLPTAAKLIGGDICGSLHWVDGLGMEFASLVCKKLEEMGYEAEVHLARANLPSTTGSNMFQGIERIDALDSYIHGKTTYQYPDDLVKELELVADEILPPLASLKKDFCLVSDHGFTVFACNKFQKVHKFKFEKVRDEGRYAELDPGQKVPHDEDVVVYEDPESERKFVLALRHISVSQTPKRESHGGATPEEVLVPVIFARVAKKVEYEVELETPSISVRNRVLRFRLKPEPKAVPEVVIGSNRYEATRTKDWFEVSLKNLRSGDYMAKITVPGFEQEVQFKVKGGIEERGL